MELFFSPLACSMATRISLYEAAADARFTQVDTKAKRTVAGDDFLAINPMGMVPTLRTDAGALLTENPAILQYVADAFPDAGLSPSGAFERAQLRQWLSFIGSELHEAIFLPLLDAKSPEAAKAYAREKIALRFGRLETHLAGRSTLLDAFSVADAYLFTILNWTFVTGIDLAKWPAVHAYYRALAQRPAIAKAFAEERALYAEEQKAKS
ncbi:MAG: glutathione S-transferase [Polyangiaceae bacterium]|nr:glutathione S-transferase [Polyangiaceae bacterium]